MDELVGSPAVGDPRVRSKARTRNGRLVYPLTGPSSGMAVWTRLPHWFGPTGEQAVEILSVHSSHGERYRAHVAAEQA